MKSEDLRILLLPFIPMAKQCVDIILPQMAWIPETNPIRNIFPVYVVAGSESKIRPRYDGSLVSAILPWYTFKSASIIVT